MKKSILNLTIEELQNELIDYKKYRAKQVFNWLHKNLVSSFEEMNNIPKDMIEYLNENYYIYNVKILQEFRSKVDETKKYLFTLKDKSLVEGVLLYYKFGVTMCISSQIGCKMGCTFCVSTKGGLVRNISDDEMIQMFYLLRKKEDDLKRIVFMGSGEPLDNYDNVKGFIKILTDSNGLCLSHRNITVSTCGIVENIYRLADDFEIKPNLAISFHNPFDEKRIEIMPVARKYSIQKILDAIDYFVNKKSRRVTIEYTLIQGQNDSSDDANRLGDIFKDKNVYVNLISLNENQFTSYKETTHAKTLIFRKILEDKKINVTIRRELGRDIEGSCGQLKNSYLMKKGVFNDKSN